MIENKNRSWEESISTDNEGICTNWWKSFADKLENMAKVDGFLRKQK